MRKESINHNTSQAANNPPHAGVEH